MKAYHVYLKIHDTVESWKKSIWNAWNRMKFRFHGIQIGKNSHLWGKIYITKRHFAIIEIGEGCTIVSGRGENPIARNICTGLTAHNEALIKIGNNVGISCACIRASERIEIGDNVKIGADSVIMDSNGHSLDYLKRRDGYLDYNSKKNAPVIIEDDVLIGARCFVLKGVTIGARSVIGAGSVVTKDIPADCIAAGNPCVVIRQKDE